MIKRLVSLALTNQEKSSMEYDRNDILLFQACLMNDYLFVSNVKVSNQRKGFKDLSW